MWEKFAYLRFINFLISKLLFKFISCFMHPIFIFFSFIILCWWIYYQYTHLSLFREKLGYLIEYYYVRSNLLVDLISIVCAIIYFILNRNITKSKWVEKYIEYSLLLLHVYLLMLTLYGTIQKMLPHLDLSVNDYIVNRGLQPFGLLFLRLNSILWVTTIVICKIIRKDILVILNRT